MQITEGDDEWADKSQVFDISKCKNVSLGYKSESCKLPRISISLQKKKDPTWKIEHYSLCG